MKTLQDDYAKYKEPDPDGSDCPEVDLKFETRLRPFEDHYADISRMESTYMSKWRVFAEPSKLPRYRGMSIYL